MSSNRWMDKEDVVHIHNGILLIHKKEWTDAICSNMDATREYSTKWNKSEREIEIPYNITCMCNLKHGINEPIYKRNKLADIENRLVFAKREEGRGE